MSCAGVSSPHTWITAGVLQTETGFMSLGHRSVRGGVQEVVIAEGIHAVIMSLGQKQSNTTTLLSIY